MEPRGLTRISALRRQGIVERWYDLQVKNARMLLFSQVNLQVAKHFGEPLCMFRIETDEQRGIHRVPGPIADMAADIIQYLADDLHCQPLVEGSVKNVPLLLQWHLEWCGAPPISAEEKTSLEAWLGIKLKDIRRE